MKIETTNIAWGENVIIADADYIDSVAFNLTVNFERMIGRHIPQADMAQWVECIAMDGGCRRIADPKEQKKTVTHVILVHSKEADEMHNFNPGTFDHTANSGNILNGQAFTGEMGEFIFHTVAADESSDSMTKLDIIADVLSAMADIEQVKRIMLIPDLDDSNSPAFSILTPVLRFLDRECQDKRITTFAMQPLTGMPSRTEILGYSLMAALGIRAEEIKG